VTSTTHEYDFATISLTTFFCELVEGFPELSEHESMEWRSPDEFQVLNWAPADIPAVQLIQQKYAAK